MLRVPGGLKALTTNRRSASYNRHRIHWTHRRVSLVYFCLNIFIFLLLALFFNAAVCAPARHLFIYCSMVGVLRSRLLRLCVYLHQKMKLLSFLFELHLHTSNGEDGWKEKLILQCARVVHADAKFSMRD